MHETRGPEGDMYSGYLIAMTKAVPISFEDLCGLVDFRSILDGKPTYESVAMNFTKA